MKILDKVREFFRGVEGKEPPWEGSGKEPLYSQKLNCMISVEREGYVRTYKYHRPRVRGCKLFNIESLSIISDNDRFSFTTNSVIQFVHTPSGRVSEGINTLNTIPREGLLEFVNVVNPELRSGLVFSRLNSYWYTRSREDVEYWIVNVLEIINKYTPQYLAAIEEETKKARLAKLLEYPKTIKKKTHKDVKEQLGDYRRKTNYKPVEVIGIKRGG